VWPDPGGTTSLVTKCHRLRKEPIGQLTTEHLRLLIGQDIGLVHLMPLALEALEKDPWVAGDFYEGDLLKNVVTVDPAFWEEHSELRERLDHIISRLRERQNLFNEEILPAWQRIYGS
jgi:hypothetical protein